MTVTTRRPERSPGPSHRPRARLWHATVGKKIVMAGTGAVLLLYLVAHMVGNLKVFFGQQAFDHYAHWLRTIGEPVLPYGWFLWLLRGVLVASVVLHIVAATQLAVRGSRARPARYEHRSRVRGSYAARTMRWGGVIIALFVVYHVLDLTLGTLNPDFRAGQPFHNVTVDFGLWFVTLFYTVALTALALHIRHGLWSAAQTLGVAGSKERPARMVATAVAVVVCGGFAVVPWAVLLGLVR